MNTPSVPDHARHLALPTAAATVSRLPSIQFYNADVLRQRGMAADDAKLCTHFDASPGFDEM